MTTNAIFLSASGTRAVRSIAQHGSSSEEDPALPVLFTRFRPLKDRFSDLSVK